VESSGLGAGHNSADIDCLPTIKGFDKIDDSVLTRLVHLLEADCCALDETCTIVGVYDLHKGGKYVWANHVAVDIWGLTREELQNMTIFDLTAPEEWPKIKQMAEKRLQTDGMIRYKEPLIGIRKDGSRFTYELVTSPIKFKGRTQYCTIARYLEEGQAIKKTNSPT
jgi:PAS domain S-box-containing protein